MDKGKQAAAVEAVVWGMLWPVFLILGILGAVWLGLILWILYRLLVILVIPGAQT